MNNNPAFEQFENDYKLKHVILNNVTYWDTENQELRSARLELFGYCFEMTIIGSKQGMKSMSTPDFELVFKATPSKNSNDFVVTLDNDSDKMFIMSPQNLELLKQHYREMNRHIPAMRESFKEKVFSIVSQLLDNNELVEMGKNFVDELPVGFYTNVDYLMLVELLIEKSYHHLGKLVFLSSQEAREYFAEKSSDFIESNQESINSYISDGLTMFAYVLKERIPEVDMYAAYLFVYNMVIIRLAQKWEQEHKEYFLDISKLDLDGAIDRYCSIETIDHENLVSAGTFIYYLINQRKFEQGNQNYLECVEVFVPKLNKIMSGKKYNQFVTRLKTSANKKKFTIDDVDLMSGQEFENFVAKLFSRMGYETEVTKATGDQGVDIIVSKNGNKIGIQAKCYSGSVGNSAIQEVVAGKNYYRLDKGIVVTNNFFTESAQQLAQANSVVLWDRNILKEKIDDILNLSSE